MRQQQNFCCCCLLTCSFVCGVCVCTRPIEYGACLRTGKKERSADSRSAYWGDLWNTHFDKCLNLLFKLESEKKMVRLKPQRIRIRMNTSKEPAKTQARAVMSFTLCRLSAHLFFSSPSWILSRSVAFTAKLHECQDFFLFKKRKTLNKSTYDLAWNYYDFFVLNQCVNDSLVLNSHRYTKPNQRKMHQNACSVWSRIPNCMATGRPQTKHSIHSISLLFWVQFW